MMTDGDGDGDGGVEEEGGADPTLSLRGCTLLPLNILTTRPDDSPSSLKAPRKAAKPSNRNTPRSLIPFSLQTPGMPTHKPTGLEFRADPKPEHKIRCAVQDGTLTPSVNLDTAARFAFLWKWLRFRVHGLGFLE